MFFEFDDCTLDVDRRELRRGGALIVIEPQVFDVLECLIRSRERVLSRDELVQAVWGGREISDAAIDTRVSAARKAIGDKGAEQRLIRTIRGKGLRFVGSVFEKPVSAVSEDRHNDPADWPTIAILPFSYGADSVQQSIAEGIVEDLAILLGKVSWLSVASHSASAECARRNPEIPEIASALNVRYLLQGSIRQLGDRQRITVRLLDGVLNCQIWSERYNRFAIDSFSALDEISEEVALAIQHQLCMAEHLRVWRQPRNALGSWGHVVRALTLMNSRKDDNVVAAQALLHRALLISPESPHIHRLLSMATTLRVHMGWADRRDLIPCAVSFAQRALELNPDEPSAHAALGYALIWKHPAEAILPCQQAVALDPNFAIGHYFLALAASFAQCPDCIFPHVEKLGRLMRADMLARGYSGALNNVSATGCFAVEQYREGVQFGRAAVLDSPNAPTAYRALIVNLVLAGEVAEARQILPTLRQLAPKFSQAWIRQNAVWTSNQVMARYVEAFRAVGLK